MQTVFITGHGGNKVVQLRDCERPARKAAEVLVRAKARRFGLPP